MTTGTAYVAFLRAINLGAKRRFPAAELRACVEAAGFGEVATYINTGNVHLVSSDAAADVRDRLESAFAADRGFEVPTVVLTLPELGRIVARADALEAEHGTPQAHYITLYGAEPGRTLAAEVEALRPPGERMVVADRAAHALLDDGVQGSRILASREFAALGQGTARTARVLRTLVEKWAEPR